MSHIVTPEKFCWLYAVGCIESRFHEHTLSEEEYHLAMHYAETKTTPPPILIRKWFPKPFKRLKEQGRECTLESMQYYWRVLHTSDWEKTPVREAHIETIQRIQNNVVFAYAKLKKKVAGGTMLSITRNIHGYDLAIGDEVLLHAGVIAEVL